jgi:hypothetical protein
MEVVWRCSAKSLEYGIWREERYGRGEGEDFSGDNLMFGKMYPIEQ